MSKSNLRWPKLAFQFIVQKYINHTLKFIYFDNSEFEFQLSDYLYADESDDLMPLFIGKKNNDKNIYSISQFENIKRVEHEGNVIWDGVLNQNLPQIMSELSQLSAAQNDISSRSEIFSKEINNIISIGWRYIQLEYGLNYIQDILYLVLISFTNEKISSST